MIPDSIRVLSKNQPSYDQLHDLIRLAQQYAHNSQVKASRMLLAEYMMHRVKTKYLSIQPVDETDRAFHDFLASRYSDCAMKEAERLSGCLAEIPGNGHTTHILCMTYMFPDRLLNSMDFVEDTNRTLTHLRALSSDDHMRENTMLAFKTPIAEALC